MPHVFTFCTAVAVLGMVATALFIPIYDDESLDMVEAADQKGDYDVVMDVLYKGKQGVKFTAEPDESAPAVNV